MNQKRRNILKGMGAAGAVGVLAGCQSLGLGGDGQAGSGGGGDGEASRAQTDPEDLPEVEATYAHLAPPEIANHNHQAAVTLKEKMETWSDGKFTVNISPAGELGSSTELVEQTSDGAIEMSGGLVEGHLAPFYPDINVYADPYAFPSIEVAQYVMDDSFGDTLREAMRQELDLRSIGWHDNGGFRNYFTGGQQIESLEDFEGLTFRNMQIEAHQEITRSLGATPEPIDWTELYSALDQGVVDGAEGSVPLFILGKFEEVQEFMILDGHVWSYVFNFANEGWFQDLHPTYQDWLLRAGHWGAINARGVNAVARKRGKQYMRDNGVEIHDPPADVRQKFKEATQENVRAVIRDQMDNPDLIDEMNQAIEDAKEQLGHDKY
jgi:TRAP-type C4-dicarboxylate transport system substrate-binding protein